MEYVSWVPRDAAHVVRGYLARFGRPVGRCGAEEGWFECGVGMAREGVGAWAEGAVWEAFSAGGVVCASVLL